MEIYKQIADPNDSFPDPTVGDVTEWEFVGLIKSIGTHYDPLKFTYSDYSGDLAKNLLKKDYTALETQFANRLKEADVLLSILDGQKVLNLMNGAVEKEALKYVYWFFSIIVDILEFDFPASNITRRKNVRRLKKGYLP
jgi:hypothetical protein